MDLFHTLDELKPFVFRITDNGGLTADRYTIVTCDGSYLSLSHNPYNALGVCLSGEGLDPSWIDKRVDSQIERDIRWIDLPKDCQRSFFDSMNEGYHDWVSSLTVPEDQADVTDISELSCIDRIGSGIYGIEGAYYVLNEEPQGPFTTLREAILYTFPEADDFSGPEYHASIDIWEQGDPENPWDRYLDPPVLNQSSPFANYALLDVNGKPFAWFAEEIDAENYQDKPIDKVAHPGPYSISHL